MSVYIRDPYRTCPDCHTAGKLQFQEMPPATRQWHDEDGGQHVQHVAASRDYWCSNCDCEFTLTTWSDEP